MKLTKFLAVALLAALMLGQGSGVARAATAAEIDAAANAVLKTLYRQTPTAKEPAGKAEAVLVFPEIVKTGLMVGGQSGEGALRKNGKTIAFYKSVGASYGLQAGQKELMAGAGLQDTKITKIKK
jgi:lipid-binding SYLF domain-containing protein